jgi:hypothetical protein
MKKIIVYIPVIALLSLAACKKSFLDTQDVTSTTSMVRRHFLTGCIGSNVG